MLTLLTCFVLRAGSRYTWVVVRCICVKRSWNVCVAVSGALM